VLSYLFHGVVICVVWTCVVSATQTGPGGPLGLTWQVEWCRVWARLVACEG
jgi:hypothetical protein